MSEEVSGARACKRPTAVAVPGNMVYSSTGSEDTKRTTRAASKRAAIDDSARPAFPAAGAQQAKKKRPALANLSNVSNIPAARSNASSGHALVAKSKPLGKAPVQGVPAVKRDKVVVADRALKTIVASDQNEDRENVAPNRIPGEEAISSTRLLVETSSKVITAPALPLTEVKASATALPLAEKKASVTARSDAAAVIESLEEKTLRNLYISRSNKKVVSGQEALTFTDIDCYHSDPQMCSIYATDIYQHLRMQEVKRRPTTAFMEALQQDINASMRGILIDWLVEVAEEYKLVPDTLYLTVSYIDRFLSKNVVSRQRLQLLGVACMLIAAKYEEICAPQVDEFCYITDNTYGREEILEMERRVLTNLHFELTTPTTKSFLRRFIRAGHSHSVPALQLEFLGNFLAELTLLEYSFLHYLPSVVAASAVFVARLTLDMIPWNSTLQHYTGYRANELEDCVRGIHQLQINSKTNTLPGIREKYSQHKFKCVATLLPVSKMLGEYFQDLEVLKAKE